MTKQSGVDELRAVVRMLNVEGELHGFSAEEIIRICRAVRACGWDVYPAQLPLHFLRFAAKRGELSKAALTWLEKHLG